jgi:hypothetical protein
VATGERRAERAPACDPTLAPAWSNNGYTLYALDRCDEALAVYDHALVLDPDYAALGAIQRVCCVKSYTALDHPLQRGVQYRY